MIEYRAEWECSCGDSGVFLPEHLETDEIATFDAMHDCLNDTMATWSEDLMKIHRPSTITIELERDEAHVVLSALHSRSSDLSGDSNEAERLFDALKEALEATS